VHFRKYSLQFVWKLKIKTTMKQTYANKTMDYKVFAIF